MSDLYTSYLSISKTEKKEINEKKEHVYASWSKEKNTWYTPIPYSQQPPPLKPPLPPPPLPDKIPIPPVINRTNKPEMYYLREGYIEIYY